MRRTTLLILLIAFATAAAPAGALAQTGWEAVDRVFGSPGKDQPGDVHRFSWPRTDLHVSVRGTAVEPGLALGSWGGFHRAAGGQAEVMGDLVLLDTEVTPVVDALREGGFEILAIHNHLIEEVPRVMYVHYMGKGEAAAIASTLKSALQKTRTPLGAPSGAAAKPNAEQEKLLASFQEAFGRKGTMAGRVLQFGVPRAEPIHDSGMEVPASMGMGESINVQAAGNRVATTGDFVLVADEVNPVIGELRAHGIAVTALHSHMLRETPRLFFMHFWGVDTPERIGQGLKAALGKVATK